MLVHLSSVGAVADRVGAGTQVCFLADGLPEEEQRWQPALQRGQHGRAGRRWCVAPTGLGLVSTPGIFGLRSLFEITVSPVEQAPVTRRRRESRPVLYSCPSPSMKPVCDTWTEGRRPAGQGCCSDLLPPGV